MAKKRKYRIVGIYPPGRVDMLQFGEVNLFELTDDKLEEILNKTGCRYIVPEIDAPKPSKDITLSRATKKNSPKGIE